MTKPRERNRQMRLMASEVVEAQIAELRARRDTLSELGIKLDDFRWHAERFQELAASSGMSRADLVSALKITRGEAAVLWPSRRRREAGKTNAGVSAGAESPAEIESEPTGDSAAVPSETDADAGSVADAVSPSGDDASDFFDGADDAPDAQSEGATSEVPTEVSDGSVTSSWPSWR